MTRAWPQREPWPQPPADPYCQTALRRENVQRLWIAALNDEAQNALLITTLSLQAYYLDHKTYPSTLNDLMPNYLHKLYRDPFALTSPLLYRKAGGKYVLYSIGPDAHDDKGYAINEIGKANTVLGPNDSHVFFPDSKGDIVAGEITRFNGYREGLPID